MRSVSLIFSVPKPVKWKGIPNIGHTAMSVWAKSGWLVKSYSILFSIREWRVNIASGKLLESLSLKLVFIPNSEKI